MAGNSLALIALTEIKLGGRKIQPGQGFIVPLKVGLKLLGTGQAAKKADGRRRRK